MPTTRVKASQAPPPSSRDRPVPVGNPCGLPRAPATSVPPKLVHPRLRREAVDARAYQLEAVDCALADPTLLVLPTGLGKTAVEWAVIAERLRAHGGKAVLVAPTNALVDQHRRMLLDMIAGSERDGALVALTGATPPAKRGALWEAAELIVATPQVVRNDVVAGRISLADVAILVLDEAHHARGAEAMGMLGEQYRAQARSPLVLAATASPGATSDAINDLCERLGLDRVHARRSEDALLAPHAVGLEVHEIRVDVPDRLKALAAPLQQWLESHVSRLRRLGWYTRSGDHITTGGVQQAFGHIQRAIAAGDARGYQAAKQAADAQRLLNVIASLLSQGVAATRESLERMARAAASGDAKVQRFLTDPRMTLLIERLQPMAEIHPKVSMVRRLVVEQLERQPDSRVMVFATFRDTGMELVTALQDVDGVRAERFVGQAKRDGDEGLSQKEQLEVLERFRDGRSNVLVATSVGEEGLDVPAADRVILYEPVGSEIRTIQRRGRTGRHRDGEVYVLLARGTRDEGARQAARAKEARMQRELDRAASRLTAPPLRDVGARLSAFAVDDGAGPVDAGDWLVARRERLLAAAEVSDREPGPAVASSGGPLTPTPVAVPEPDERDHAGRRAQVTARRLRPQTQMGLDAFAGSTTAAARPSDPSGDEDAGEPAPPDAPEQTLTSPALASSAHDADEVLPPPDSPEGHAAGARLAEVSLPNATTEELSVTTRPDPSPAARTGLPLPAPRTSDGRVIVVVDDRELNSTVAAALRLQSVELEATRLQHGDYRIGDRVLVERKTARDFVASLLDGRLLEQASRLVSAAPRAFLLVEGTDLFHQRSVHPNALMGAMACLVIEFGLPVIVTSNAQETARFIAVAARREEALITGLEQIAKRRLDTQRSIAWRRLVRGADGPLEAADPLAAAALAEGTGVGATLEDVLEEAEAAEAADALASATRHPDAPPPSEAEPPSSDVTPMPPRWEVREAELAVLQSIPGVGPNVATALLERFGSLPAVIAASETELMGTAGLGPARAAAIHRLFSSPE